MNPDPRRLRVWLDRVLATSRDLERLTETVDALADKVGHLDHLAQRSHHLIVTDGDRIASLAETITQLAVQVDSTPGTADSDERIQAAITDLRSVVHAPRAEEAMRSLIAAMPESDAVEPGLSLLIDATASGDLESTMASWPADRTIVLGPHDATLPTACTGIRSPIPLGTQRGRAVLAAACTTRHAVFASPGDHLDHRSLDALHTLAVEWEATVARGVVTDPDGPIAHATGGASTLTALRLADGLDDTLAVIDVVAVRSALLSGVTLSSRADEVPLTARLAELGGLVVFVPIVAGRRTAASSTPVAPPLKPPGEIQPPAPPFEDEQVAVAVVHPDTGPMWASNAAVSQRPALARALPTPMFSARLPVAPASAPLPEAVLVVSAGGTRQLVHDADTAATIRRLRKILPPQVAIEVVSEGSRPSSSWDSAVWFATRRELGSRLITRHRAVVIVGGEFSDDSARFIAGRRMIATVAAQAAIPVLATGISIGSFTDGPDAAHIRSLLESIRAVSTIDASTESKARQLGARDVSVLGCAASVDRDLPWPDPPSVDHIVFQPFPTRPVDGEPRLAHNAHEPVRLDETIRSWSEAVDTYAGAHGREVVALATTPDEVGALMHIAEYSRHAPWRIVDATDSVELAWALLDASHGAVAAASHVASWATQLRRPSVLLGHDAEQRADPEGLAESLAVIPDRPRETDPDEMHTRWLATHLESMSSS